VVRLGGKLFRADSSQFSSGEFLSKIRHPLRDWKFTLDDESMLMTFAIPRPHNLASWWGRCAVVFGVREQVLPAIWECEQNGLGMIDWPVTGWGWDFMEEGQPAREGWHVCRTKTPPGRIQWTGDRRLVLACGAGFAGPKEAIFRTEKYLGHVRQFLWCAKIIRTHLDAWSKFGDRVVEGVRMADGETGAVWCDDPDSYVLLQYCPDESVLTDRPAVMEKWGLL